MSDFWLLSEYLPLLIRHKFTSSIANLPCQYVWSKMNRTSLDYISFTINPRLHYICYMHGLLDAVFHLWYWRGHVPTSVCRRVNFRTPSLPLHRNINEMKYWITNKYLRYNAFIQKRHDALNNRLAHIDKLMLENTSQTEINKIGSKSHIIVKNELKMNFFIKELK